MTKIRNLFARMEKRRKERRTKSRFADDKAVDDFTRVLDTAKPSAFDVAMEETRQSDAVVWAKLERDLKPEP